MANEKDLELSDEGEAAARAARPVEETAPLAQCVNAYLTHLHSAEPLGDTFKLLKARVITAACQFVRGVAPRPPTAEIRYPCGCLRQYCPTHAPSYLGEAPRLVSAPATIQHVLAQLFELTGAEVVEIHSGDREPGRRITREQVERANAVEPRPVSETPADLSISDETRAKLAESERWSEANKDTPFAMVGPRSFSSLPDKPIMLVRQADSLGRRHTNFCQVEVSPGLDAVAFAAEIAKALTVAEPASRVQKAEE